MTIQPTQYYLLIEMRDLKADTKIVLPEGLRRQPHGLVLATGPDCKFCTAGDLVLFLPQNLIGFEGQEEFILPESAVFAKFQPDDVVPMS